MASDRTGRFVEALALALIAAVLVVPFEHQIKHLADKIPIESINNFLSLSISLKVYQGILILLFMALVFAILYLIIKKFFMKNIWSSLKNVFASSASKPVDTKTEESEFDKVRKSIEGTWEYECRVSEGMDFPFPKNAGYAHGGQCTINTEKEDYGTKVIVRGLRTWHYIKNGTKYKKEFLKEPFAWQEVFGTFISPTKIIYTYAVVGQAVHGVSILEWKDNGLPPEPHGSFYYFPSPLNPSQSIDINNVKQRQRGRKFGEISGKVTYTRPRSD